MKHKVKRLIVAVLLLCMMAAVFTPATARAATTTGGDRFNIMLVIDGSGSLTSPTAGNTDPKGMRYDLISSLMSILEADGHNIGAIVFSGTQKKTASDADMAEGIMLNTGLLSTDRPAPDGRPVKDYVEGEVRDIYVDNSRYGCTDIGTALKEAQEQLQQMQAQNGLQSVVFLFTDGNTAFYGNPPAVVEKSMENRDNATLAMSQNGIRLFGAFLNNGGHLDDSEMKRLVCAANGISATSPEFAYSYVEIRDADSALGITNSFLKFLGKIDPNWETKILYEDYHEEFIIPGMGVEEMNFSIYSPYGDDLPDMNVKITQPDGTVIDAVPINESRIFRVYKLVDPEPGLWMIDIHVPEGNRLAYAYTPVISLDIQAVTESRPAPADLCVNTTADFSCYLARNGSIVTDAAAYRGYECRLEIQNVGDGSVDAYDVQVNTSGLFSQPVLLDTYGNFAARTIFSCGDIVVASDWVDLDLTNKAPEGSYPVHLDLKYGLFQPKSTDVDLTQYVSDPEDGSNLRFTIESATCDEDACDISGSTLTIDNKKMGDNFVVITATDSQGASCSQEVYVETTGVTIWYILALILLIIIIVIIVLMSIKAKNDNRPDGELSVSFDMTHDGRSSRISLDLAIPGVETTSKTNLYKLIQSALREEDRKIATGIYARDVVSFLIPFSKVLGAITVEAAIKTKGKKKHGAVSVRQGKKATVLYNSFADFFLNEVSFTVEFKANEDEQPDPFADDPFANPGGNRNRNEAANPFGDMDDLF